MKITRTLKITTDEFYNYLEQDLMHRILEISNKEIKPSDIKKGLRYSKKDGDLSERIDISVIDYKRGEYYKSKIKTTNDSMTLTYKTKPCDEGVIVDFIQIIDGFENSKQGKFMRTFSEGVYLGRMTDALYEIQNNVEKQREGIDIFMKKEKKKGLLSHMKKST